jgi:hypothetical protein
MIAFAFAFFSGAKAMADVHDCDAVSGGVKHWQALPPQWLCSPGHFQITADSR